MQLYLASDRDGWLVKEAAKSMRMYLASSGLYTILEQQKQVIKDMRLYLADTNEHHLRNGFYGAKKYFSVLMSYFYLKGKNMEKVLDNIFETHTGIDLFADSGAFSAHSLGKPLSVQEYAEWLHQWKHLFTVYANLDVKGDVDAGLRNQAYLESQGLRPLPVFHGGEPLTVLADLIKDYPYIALGGLAGETQSGSREMWAFVVKCFQLAQGKTVFHGFGMTNWKLMAALPWYSCDSSSWGQGFRFGNVPLFSPLLGKFLKVKVGDPASAKAHATLIRSYGVDPLDFADRSRYHASKAAALAAASYVTAEDWLTKRHGVISIPQRTGKWHPGNTSSSGPALP